MFKVNADGLKEFEISRAKWARGEGGAELLNFEHRQCCLGIFATACGIPDADIFCVTEPDGIANRELVTGNEDYSWTMEQTRDYKPHNSEDAVQLIYENDEVNMDDTERESRITKIFQAHGYLPIFVD